MEETEVEEFVFVRFRENGKILCTLVWAPLVTRFLEAPERFVTEEYDGAELLAWWRVPEQLENAVVGDNIREIFDALMGLNALSDIGPPVSDLFATLIQAGFDLCEANKA